MLLDETHMLDWEVMGLLDTAQFVRRNTSSFTCLTKTRKNHQGFCSGNLIRGKPSNLQGKEVRIHGASVRTTRKPMLTSRRPVTYLPRTAERRILGTLTQEPPRKTRAEQFPLSHALPSLGDPA